MNVLHIVHKGRYAELKDAAGNVIGKIHPGSLKQFKNACMSSLGWPTSPDDDEDDLILPEDAQAQPPNIYRKHRNPDGELQKMPAGSHTGLFGELKTLVQKRQKQHPKESFAACLSAVAKSRPDLWERHKHEQQETL